ncbi:hypothetical protein [Fusobacterium necrophorum]|uniref:Uncharacterized protein n=1 Tax=Fusobacterium necrophorum subsp. funduliforme TaxID=143387 RepID=A0A162J8T7_9FUSO|nr:hypothetical protein [Fusobacterium necrophorum]KYL05349.1 hypothetical protein A2J07_01015 [Fusobacterium necrophorum subsp. funduliforme]
MLFSLNENGDLNLRGNAFSDIVLSDKNLTEYKMSKSIILTYFIFNKWLEQEFIKNKRNIFNEQNIQQLIQKRLFSILEGKYDTLMSKIDFVFLLEPSLLTIVFYLKQDDKKYSLLEKQIKI